MDIGVIAVNRDDQRHEQHASERDHGVPPLDVVKIVCVHPSYFLDTLDLIPCAPQPLSLNAESYDSCE